MSLPKTFAASFDFALNEKPSFGVSSVTTWRSPVPVAPKRSADEALSDLEQ
jgi:hypothetical protein